MKFCVPSPHPNGKRASPRVGRTFGPREADPTDRDRKSTIAAATRVSKLNSLLLKQRLQGLWWVLLFGFFPSLSTAVEIRNAYPKFIEERDFQRIGEFFSGKENAGRRVVLRSQPEVRGGVYFIITLDRDARRLPPDATLEIQLFSGGEKAPKTFSFPLPRKRPASKEIFAGLTGEDWPERDAVVSAWKITLRDAEGKVLARKKSFLWDYP